MIYILINFLKLKLNLIRLMSHQILKSKLFNSNNIKILEEEKPRINKKIPESQFKKFTFINQNHCRNNQKLTSFDLPTNISERPKHFYTVNSHSNLNNNYRAFINNNSSHELNSNNFDFKNSNVKKKINSKNNILVHKKFNDDNLLEIVFDYLGVEKIYLEKLYSNKIDFSDLLFLTKDDLKEMNIPIGPRNRLLNFIFNFTTYKENLKIEKYDLNILYNYFNKITPIFNKQNDNEYIISPKVNIKSKYNNDFSTNVDNSILIKQEIRNYLNNNPHNITVNLNKTLITDKKNQKEKKSQSPFNSNKVKKNKNITIHSFSNDNFNKTHCLTNSYCDNINRNSLNKDSKNKYKPNSKLKLISVTNNNKNTSKQYIIYDYKNSKTNINTNKKQSKEKEKKTKIQKTLYSFSEEGLDLLNKMKDNLNTQLNNFTQSISDKKFLLKLFENSNK